MRTYKFIAICVASLFFGTYDDGLGEVVGLHIKVTTNENASFDGQIVTAKKGTPIEFIFSGDPDFLTFFSGETGSGYEYRGCKTIDPSQIESSMLNSPIWFQYGSPSTTLERHVYISDEFTGLYKDNLEADFSLAEQPEKGGKWKELVPQSAFPAAVVGNADPATPYSSDVKEYMDKRIAIAIRYRGIDNTVTQPKMYFERIRINNVMTSEQEARYSAGPSGLTLINMKSKQNLKDQTSMAKDREYGTITNNVSGIRSLIDVDGGSFSIHYTNADDPLRYSWPTSDLVIVNFCSPDQRAKVKDIVQCLDKYTYTYSQIGIYNVTFFARNANINHSSTTTYHMVVNIVE